MDKGNPRVRIDPRVLDSYRRLADSSGLRIGELMAAVLEEALRNPWLVMQAAEKAWRRRGRRLRDYEAYAIFRSVRLALERLSPGSSDAGGSPRRALE